MEDYSTTYINTAAYVALKGHSYCIEATKLKTPHGIGISKFSFPKLTVEAGKKLESEMKCSKIGIFLNIRNSLKREAYRVNP